MNDRATAVSRFWADQFPNREPEHFVFPRERYGAGGDKFVPCVHSIDPSRPIHSWKKSWASAKAKANVTVRFHDLRHTCVTGMLEGGAPLSVVASIMGWSAATTVQDGQALRTHRPACPTASACHAGPEGRTSSVSCGFEGGNAGTKKPKKPFQEQDQNSNYAAETASLLNRAIDQFHSAVRNHCG